MDPEALIADFKTKANIAFKAKRFEEAAEKYQKALEADPNHTDAHLLLSNRAACLIALERFEDALEDAKRCVQLKPDWAKGFARMGASLFFLKRLQQAREVICLLSFYLCV